MKSCLHIAFASLTPESGEFPSKPACAVGHVTVPLKVGLLSDIENFAKFLGDVFRIS
jgi:hypothetical protein